MPTVVVSHTTENRDLRGGTCQRRCRRAARRRAPATIACCRHRATAVRRRRHRAPLPPGDGATARHVHAPPPDDAVTAPGDAVAMPCATTGSTATSETVRIFRGDVAV